MAQVHENHREVLDAIRSIAELAPLLGMKEDEYVNKVDLEVMVYGRNYTKKKVGPYVRLLTYKAKEVVYNEGEWSGNTFYIIVSGELEIVHGEPAGKTSRLPGRQFGMMSVLAGVPRDETIRVCAGGSAQVLEIQRPALRLLRKFPEFGNILDRTYRTQSRNSAVEGLGGTIDLEPQLIHKLKGITRFRVYSRNHVLFSEAADVERIYIITEGWVRRSKKAANGAEAATDFLGKGFCFGLEEAMKGEDWPYTTAVLGRTEVLEIAAESLRKELRMRPELLRELSRLTPPDLIAGQAQQQDTVQEVRAAQEKLIATGLVDATNLLVMDMDLCVRCGNCSLACHKVHGQSRLVRRGIHLQHLVLPKKRSRQSVLSPQVCMHCKDPECLTGCPTGAISRREFGQVDIDKVTCIGCGDCATQCPYHAISMVPREANAPPAGSKPLSLFRDLLGLQSHPLPEAVEQPDNLQAVKCNLCVGTTMNPKGSRRPAYACEENCPTGALARINPVEYFKEIGQIKGLAFVDQNQAVGRNIHKSDPPKRLIHLIGILITLLLTGWTIYGLARHPMARPIIGSLSLRLITGLTGLAGTLVATYYPIRRRVYNRRRGALRHWLLVHAYAGVIAGVMLLLHGGDHSGGMLTTVLMITFDLVIATGLIGILCYLIVPRLLTRIEGTPLLIEDLHSRRTELQTEIADAMGAASPQVRGLISEKVLRRFLSLGNIARQCVSRATLEQLLASAEVEFKADVAKPTNTKERSALKQAVESAATLARVEALICLHRTLRIWLLPHIVFTSLMLALMAAHIIQVIYFAWR